MFKSLCVLAEVAGLLRFFWKSFKTLEMREDENRLEQLKTVSTYWTVYGFLHVFEVYLEIVISWFPLYYTFKFVVLLLIFFPQFKGVEIVYQEVLLPELLFVEESIEYIHDSIAAIDDLFSPYLQFEFGIPFADRIPSFPRLDLPSISLREISMPNFRNPFRSRKAAENNDIHKELQNDFAEELGFFGKQWRKVSDSVNYYFYSPPPQIEEEVPETEEDISIERVEIEEEKKPSRTSSTRRRKPKGVKRAIFISLENMLDFQ